MLMEDSIKGMQKQIIHTATYVNERMLLDDWLYGYISTKEYFHQNRSADISFVKDRQDPSPHIIYRRRFIFYYIKRILWQAVKLCRDLINTCKKN